MTVLIETTIDLAIEADLFVRFQDFKRDDFTAHSKMPVYLAIFAVAQYVSPLAASYTIF